MVIVINALWVSLVVLAIVFDVPKRVQRWRSQ